MACCRLLLLARPVKNRTRTRCRAASLLQDESRWVETALGRCFRGIPCGIQNSSSRRAIVLDAFLTLI